MHSQIEGSGLLFEAKEVTNLFQNKFWKIKKDFYLCTPNRNEREQIEKRQISNLRQVFNLKRIQKINKIFFGEYKKMLTFALPKGKQKNESHLPQW